MKSANGFGVLRTLDTTPGGQRTAFVVSDMRVGVAIGVVCALLCVAGCGGNDDGVPPQVVTQIPSDARFDGDIEQTSATSYTITQGMSPSVQSILAGVDPATGNEFRA